MGFDRLVLALIHSILTIHVLLPCLNGLTKKAEQIARVVVVDNKPGPAKDMLVNCCQLFGFQLDI
jgi:hypothetical protein